MSSVETAAALAASLPMYDLPELRRATDGWWAVLARALTRAGLPEVPSALDRQREREAVWRDPHLLLTQTCGYPITHGFAGVLRAVAAPDYRAEGCGDGLYRSVFVVRDDDPAAGLADLRGRTVAANDPESQSGCNCLRAAVAPLAKEQQFFSEVRWTGAHRASLAAVASGAADIAAIDGVTFALVGDVAPAEASGLRVLAWSEPAPALPYAATAATPTDRMDRLRDGLAAAVADPEGAAARDALRLRDLIPTDDAAYAPIVAMRETAEARGYPELA